MKQLLSQRLRQLQEDTNKETGFSQEMIYGFNHCIKQAEDMEKAVDTLVDYIFDSSKK